MRTRHVSLIGGALVLGWVLLSSAPTMVQSVSNVSPQLVCRHSAFFFILGQHRGTLC